MKAVGTKLVTRPISTEMKYFMPGNLRGNHAGHRFLQCGKCTVAGRLECLTWLMSWQRPPTRSLGQRSPS